MLFPSLSYDLIQNLQFGLVRIGSVTLWQLIRESILKVVHIYEGFLLFKGNLMINIGFEQFLRIVNVLVLVFPLVSLEGNVDWVIPAEDFSLVLEVLV